MTENAPRAIISAAIAETAADWIVRRDGGKLSADDERSFQEWLSEPAHRRALERLEELWCLIDSDPAPVASQPGLPPIALKRRSIFGRNRSSFPPPARKPRRWAGAAVAASVALAAFASFGDWPTRLRADYATGVGERRLLTLEDGSRVTLGSSSAIVHDFSGTRRQIRLLEGSALFEVAPDRSRPFTVEAAGGSATALGTAFAVRERDGIAELVVTQHRVRVIGGGRSAIVDEGRRVDFDAETLGAVEAAGNGATAWTRGRLVVVNRPLREVVAEIARYRHGYLSVTGTAAEVKVSGVYDLDHPLEAVDSIERSLNLKSFRFSDRLIVLHR
ncbi:FecR family protein [Novosphingobium sp. PhB165]|uniref:FecR family protein n=1 Tax=Novosphingobium sp. PhB165 TaxID=2485105 RepID=UPI0010F12291|nr:FecR family protein [Novosphingobium sp. PhB165]TCM16504.1 FecR family protein [Novosphingobium sp. PhB165]